MPGPAAERADAARNRDLILRAAADLLVRHGPGRVSIDDVAAAAGVGKGTVFRRFGSRAGLLHALVEQHVLDLAETVASGPPPLGPGAPPAQRLIAFLDAAVAIATRNAAILAAYDHARTSLAAEGIRSVYNAWHAHIAALVAAARPDLDAELLAHILLGSLHSDPARDHPDRLAAALRQLVTAVLNAPPTAC